jgi:hypothetical protein
MTFIDFEWLDFEQHNINTLTGRYEYFAPDIWWSEKQGCYQTAIQDMEASYEQGEIVNVNIIPKREVKFMWE